MNEASLDRSWTDALVAIDVGTSGARAAAFDLEGRRRWLREWGASGTRQRLDELMTSFGAPRQTSRLREPGSQRPAMAKN